MSYRGKSLKALRETKQINLRWIANQTRISLVYLQDLEEERFDRFPGAFYFASFTKEYASALGLDSSEVVNDLRMAYDEWSDESSDASLTTAALTNDDGTFNRIIGYFRNVQEV
jgi:cytoskeletal protein RodZ